MKLYATVTSERATKGQGGNEFIGIDLFDSEKIHLGNITLKRENGNYILYLELDSERVSVKDETKGEKQKGDKCSNCYKNTAQNGLPLCESCRVQLDQ